MAFNTGNTQSAAAPATQQNTDWKAQGFLNFYLPMDGKRVKLGAIPLKESNARGVNEKKMLEWLNEDPSRVSKILAQLVIEFKPVETTESKGADLYSA